MVSESIVAVTIPYSSPAYVAAALGIPSIFYDPTGTLVPSYEEVHGLQYAAGISDLRTALNAAFEASTTTQP
jgi:polysaccharide biosynthesis PFTS motif protein